MFFVDKKKSEQTMDHMVKKGEQRREEGGSRWGGLGSSLDRTKSGAAKAFQDVDEGGMLRGQSGTAAAFADRGQQNYLAGRGGALEARDYLGRTMRGENSVSQEQLRQALGQGVSQQAAMAASARPGNQAMAARNAMMNAGNMASGMAGQQALAGIQERNAAAQQYGQLAGQIADQDLRATLGSRGQALGGYGTYEGQRTARYGAALGVPTTGETLLGGLQGAGTLLAAMSDRTRKTNIDGDPDGDVRAFMEAIKPASYKYKEKRDEAPLSSAEQPHLRAQRLLGSSPEARQATFANERLYDELAMDPRNRAYASAHNRMVRRRAEEPRRSLDVAVGRPTVRELPDGPGTKRHLGVMAQDLEKTPLGKSMVIDTPRGKAINTGALTGALAAGVGDLDERIRRLEEKKRNGGG